MKDEAQVVIIGAGAMGAGLFYHLAHEGWTDTVLVDKGELSSGSTWHAAGLIPHFIGSLNMAKCHAVAPDLYERIEAETGMSSGWHGTGAIRLALDRHQVDWFRYVSGMLDLIGVENHLIEPKEILDHWPFMDVSDVKLGFWTPNDGWTDPSSVTAAMVKGARQLGGELARHTLVTETNPLPDGRWEVVYEQKGEQGRIVCDHLVNAAGCYAPQVGAMAGVEVPIVSVIHQYLITETMQEMVDLGDFDPPVVRDPRASSYYRREIDSLLVGPYERANAQTYGVEGIDWDLHFYLTPPDLDTLMPWLIEAGRRIPAFENAGIKTVVSGPITHTPDSGYLMGPAPGVRNYWMCAGASIGITQGPGAGKFLAQWMVHGQTEVNVAEMDPRRFGDHCGPTGRYAIDKAIDEFHEMYATRRPGEQRFAGRPQKTDPIYERLEARGAQWEEVFGWERPQYFGEPEDHTFRRSNAFDAVGAEVNGTRDRAGLADLTAFSKFEVTGADAETFLERMAANTMPKREGGIRLTHFLTTLGGIESEMTITRLGGDRFYLNSGITAQFHDRDWLLHHIGADGADEDVVVTDRTDDLAILAVAGPRSRDILQPLTDADLSNDSFRWLTGQEIIVAGVPCIALRVSYVGELGWELHHPIERMTELYDALVAAGEPHGMVHYGSYAMNVMRVEKAYKAMGSELTTEITPVEAELGRFIDLSRPFIGRDAVQERLDVGRDKLGWLLVYCEVGDGGEPADNDCRGNEPVYDNGEIIGLTTSGAYGHSVGRSLAFAYVAPSFAHPGATFEIQLQGASGGRPRVLADAAHDPGNDRIRV